MELQLIFLLVSVSCVDIGKTSNITLTPLKNNFIKGDAVTLTCEVDLSKKAVYYTLSWYKDDTEVSRNSTVTNLKDSLTVKCNFTSNTHKLTIGRAKTIHRGKYKCEACSGFSKPECIQSQFADVSVYELPTSPICKQDSYDVKEDEIIDFICKGKFVNPPKSLEMWLIYADERQQIEEKVVYNSRPNTDYIMLNAQHYVTHDLNNANVYCEAKFAIPNTTTNCTSGPFNVSYSPRVLSTNVTYSIAESKNDPSNATIAVDITSNPEAIVTWSRNGGNFIVCILSGRSKYLYTYICYIYNITNDTEAVILAVNYFGTTNQSLTLAWDRKTSTTFKLDDIDYETDNNNYILPLTISATLVGVIVVIIVIIIKIRKKRQLKNRHNVIPAGSSIPNSSTQHIYETKLYEINSGDASVSKEVSEYRGRSNVLNLPNIDPDEADDERIEKYIEIDHPRIENNARVIRTIERVEYTEVIDEHSTATDSKTTQNKSTRLENTTKRISCIKQCQFNHVMMKDNQLECSLCQKQYHRHCLKIKSTTTPKVWLCPYCKNMPGTFESILQTTSDQQQLISDMACNIASLTAMVKEQKDLISNLQTNN